MRKVTFLTMFIIFVASVSLVMAFGLPGGGKKGPKLKKVDKELKISDISPKFKKLEGTGADPFKDSPYKYRTYGDPAIDGMLTSANKILATPKFGAALVADMTKQIGEAKTTDDVKGIQENATVLVEVLTGLVTEGQKVASDGQKLVTSLPNTIMKDPMNAGVLKGALEDIGAVLKGLPTALKDVGAMLKNIKPLMETIGAKTNELEAQGKDAVDKVAP